jgi:S1-C subfamily serine protease
MNRPSPASLVVFALGLAFAGVGLATRVGAAARGEARMTPVVRAVQHAAPAVVTVTTDIGGKGWWQGGTRGSGAGVIVHPDGYVVTNSHVVRGASRIYVTLPRANGGRAFEARLLQDQPQFDLALLRVGGGPFPFVAICSTCDVMVGETAIAIGNPYGLGDTVTTGVVSAKGRTATFSSGHTLKNLIQTDASINLGNSGGALLNIEGELIGINSAVHANAQGIAFTVPADDVQAMLDRHLGAASRPAAPRPPAMDAPYEAPRTFTPAMPAPSEPAPRAAAPRRAEALPDASARPPQRAMLGLSLRAVDGQVVVDSVTPNSNADIAGVRAGDVVFDVDGHRPESPAALAGTWKAAQPGQSYLVTLGRGDRKTTAIVVIP